MNEQAITYYRDSDICYWYFLFEEYHLKPMWISEKKRLLQKLIGKKAVIYCLECLAMASIAQGLEPTLFDIGDRKSE